MGGGGISGRLWLRKKKKTGWESRVLDLRQGSGSGVHTGDRGRSRVLEGPSETGLA